MSAAKKTIIKIKNLDDSQPAKKAPAAKEKEKTVKGKALNKKKEKVDETEAVENESDVRIKMQKKLASAKPENWDDLSVEESSEKDDKKDTRKSKVKTKDSETIDLSSSNEKLDFASKIRKKLSMRQEDEPVESIESDNVADLDEIPKTAVEETEAKEEKSVSGNVKTDGEADKVDENEESLEKPKVHLKLYRNIAIFFILGTLLVLSVVFYFTAVKLTIVVTPKEEKVSDSLIFSVKDPESADSDNAIEGAVESVILEESKNYPASGEKIIGEDAVGKITIYNNYVKNQPLVATTRFLAANGVLFRLKNTVNVPAGGSVEAEIYADKPSPDIFVAPTKFTIPGLWAGIQDKIYGESSETIKYEQQTEKTVQQSDIDNAVLDLKKVLIAGAKEQITGMFKDYDQVIYEVDESSITQNFDAKVGDKVSEFKADMKAAVAVVAFRAGDVEGEAEEKLSTALPAEKRLARFNNDSLTFKLDSYNLAEKTASVSVAFDAFAIANTSSGLIDKNNILGLSEKQLNTYMSSQSGVSAYELKFKPSWLKIVPKLADNVEIIIKD